MIQARVSRSHRQRGFSLVEVVVATALVVLVFGGLFGAVQAMINLISNSKAKAGAVALATERLEYIRSLSYDDVGTLGGVPSGAIPQTRMISLNDIAYRERVLVEFVDDPADGEAGADSNGIVADYKRAKVELSWVGRNGTSSVALVSNIVPPGVETTAGGGTLRVYVNDAAVLPVAGATVRFVNTTGTSTIDTIRYTDPNGIAQLGGAPALGSYEIYVSRAGYSRDGTATTTPPLSSPKQPVVSVGEAAVTTQYFQIDELSDLTITTRSQPTYGSQSEPFDNLTNLVSLASTTLTSGALVLTGSPGTYAATGTAVATSSLPSPLVRWYTLAFTASTSASTTAAVQLWHPTGTSTYALVPDSDLPGNSNGFTSSPVDLTALATSTYPALLVGARLRTVDPAVTPAMLNWELTHVASEPSLSGIPLTVRGAKTLGTDAAGEPVLKTVYTGSTDSSGTWSLSDIEYDVYSVTLDDPSLDVLEVCPAATISLPPDSSRTVDFTVGSIAGARLLVTVTDATGVPVPGASVRVEQSGYDVTQTTSLCGQTMFSGGGLSSGLADIMVDKTGYALTEEPDVMVSATSSVTIQIN